MMPDPFTDEDELPPWFAERLRRAPHEFIRAAIDSAQEQEDQEL